MVYILILPQAKFSLGAGWSNENLTWPVWGRCNWICLLTKMTLVRTLILTMKTIQWEIGRWISHIILNQWLIWQIKIAVVNIRHHHEKHCKKRHNFTLKFKSGAQGAELFYFSCKVTLSLSYTFMQSCRCQYLCRTCRVQSFPVYRTLSSSLPMCAL